MIKKNNVPNLSKTVNVLGLGHIGLPLAVLAALRGYLVFGVDIDQSRLEQIRQLDERGMESSINFLLQDEIVMKNLLLSSTVDQSSDYFVICVPTPLNDSLSPNLDYVKEAIRAIGQKLSKGSTVIIESTMPVGATKKMADLLEKQSGLILNEDFFVAYSIERLFPGQAFKELVFNDRVIGGVGDRSSDNAANFYLPLVRGRIFQVDSKTAELTKITENAHRSVEIAFANQISEFAKRVGVDPLVLIELANNHPRVNILKPGVGVGGDCIPTHPYFLGDGQEVPSIILESLKINVNQTHLTLLEILDTVSSLKNRLKRKVKVLLLGLTYKANVQDLRNSPALFVAKELSKSKKVNLKVCEPTLSDSQISLLGLQSVELSEYKNMDLTVFLVGHDKFLSLKKTFLYEKSYLDPIGFLKKDELTSPKKEIFLN